MPCSRWLPQCFGRVSTVTAVVFLAIAGAGAVMMPWRAVAIATSGGLQVLLERATTTMSRSPMKATRGKMWQTWLNGSYDDDVIYLIREKCREAADVVPWSSMPSANLTCLADDNNRHDDEDQLLFSTNSSSSWQTRAPYFFVLGAQKSGTTSFGAYLAQHPYIIESPNNHELHFFDNKGIINAFVTDHGTRRDEARKAIWSRLPQQTLQNDTNLISYDETTNYLFLSHTTPWRVFCVCPWTQKFLAILRNPVDRAFSHFNMMMEWPEAKDCNTFEAWVEDDLCRMKQSGLIHDDDDDDDDQELSPAGFAGSVSEEEAWVRYLNTFPYGVLGRGLYVLQLEQWIRAFNETKKNMVWSDHFRIYTTEDMNANKQHIFDQAVSFLGLPPHPLPPNVKKYNTRKYNAMKNSTRKMLEDFFAPYNQRLYELLKWDHPVW